MTGRFPSLFITGTDTGIGKTILTATLLACLREAGHNAIAMKPLQTGAEFDGVRWRSPDLAVALRWAGLAEPDASDPRLAPYCFEPACSPHLAAREAGVQPTVEHIRRQVSEVHSQYSPILCEGAGGVRVPINETEDMLDLMADLGFPVLVAARPSLGTLNHTLLTVDALRSRSVEVLGVVLVRSTDAEWGPIEEDNRQTIRERSGVSLVTPLPYVASVCEVDRVPDSLRRAGAELIEQIQQAR